MLSTVRLLDLAGLGATAWLGGTLLFWSGWSRSFWARPEHVFLLLLGIVSLRLLIAPVAVPTFNARRAVAVGVSAYALIFSFITVTRHFTFRTHALDLGYYVQLTWNLARGEGPYVSLPEMHAWGDHLSPIMYFFVPAFWAVPGPVILLVAQSVMLGAGALPVFGIARHYLGDERPAAAFALLYLVNPSLHGINVRDFHAAALAIPLLLAAMYFALEGRLWLFGTAVALTLACREDATIPVVGLGAWLAVGRGQRFGGAGVALGALGLLLADIRWIVPYFRGQAYPHLARYEYLGNSLGGIAMTILLHPFRVLAGLLTGGRIVYLLALLGPLALLPLLAPAALLGMAPPLFENLLGRDPVLYNHRAQYQAFVLPFVMLAAVDGYSRVAARTWGRWPVAILAVAFLLSLALASPAANDLAVARWWPNAEQRSAYTVLSQIPAAASVSAQDRYVAHLSLRHVVAVFPVALDRVDYVLVNVRTYPWRNLPDVTLERAGNTVIIATARGAEFHYAVAAQAGPHLLLHRLRPTGAESTQCPRSG